MYDEEAVYQDADIEMAELTRQGRAAEIARARGNCPHSSWVGLPDSGEIFYPEQEGLVGDQVRCTDICGEVFADDEDIDRARWGTIWG